MYVSVIRVVFIFSGLSTMESHLSFHSLVGDYATVLIKLIPVYLSKMPWLRERFASQTRDQQINLHRADCAFSNSGLNLELCIWTIKVVWFMARNTFVFLSHPHTLILISFRFTFHKCKVQKSSYDFLPETKRKNMHYSQTYTKYIQTQTYI